MSGYSFSSYEMQINRMYNKASRKVDIRIALLLRFSERNCNFKYCGHLSSSMRHYIGILLKALNSSMINLPLLIGFNESLLFHKKSSLILKKNFFFYLAWKDKLPTFSLILKISLISQFPAFVHNSTETRNL